MAERFPSSPHPLPQHQYPMSGPMPYPPMGPPPGMPFSPPPPHMMPGMMVAPPPPAHPPIEIGMANQTLYLQNLNERVKIPLLIETLQKWFAPFGKILEVKAKKRLALRGQAFITFSAGEEARKALESMQGRRLFGKSLCIKFARFKSDLVSKADGSFESEFARRQADKIERQSRPRLTRRQIMAQMMNNPTTSTMFSVPQGMMPMMANPAMPGPMMPAMAPIPLGAGGDVQLPNKILFIQNIPQGIGQEQITTAFRQFPQLVEVRMIPNRPDLAFVEYESEQAANTARAALDRYEMLPGSQPIRVLFARR